MKESIENIQARINIIESMTTVVRIVDKLIDRVAALEEDTRLIAVEERTKKLQKSVDKLEGDGFSSGEVGQPSANF